MLFLNILQNTALLKNAVKVIAEHRALTITALNEMQRIYLAAALIGSHKGACLLLVKNRAQMRSYGQIFSGLYPQLPTYELTAAGNGLSSVAENKNYELIAQRYQALEALSLNTPAIVYITPEDYIAPYPQHNATERRLKILTDTTIAMGTLLEILVDYGYTRTDKVFDIGEFSVRGDIVDIYPLNSPHALRIEFFGEEIDGLRYFDVLTQRSVENIDSVEILPLVITASENTVSLTEYLSSALLIIDDLQEHMNTIADFLEDNSAAASGKYLSYENFTQTLSAQRFVNLTFAQAKPLYSEQILDSKMLSTSAYHHKVDLFIEDAKDLLSQGRMVFLAMSNSAKAKAVVKNMREMLPMHLALSDNDAIVQSNTVNCMICNIQDGFILPQDNLAVITEKDLFGMVKQRKFAKTDEAAKINYFTDIKLGDFVVHNIHGIGQYVGIDKIEVDGNLKDYIILNYAGTDKLYVPVEQVTNLHKYIGNDGIPPKLSKMGGSDWTRLRNKAKLAITDMAQELLRLYAQREIVQGFEFPADDVWQQEFEDAFEYEETPDQLTATAEIKKDMQSQHPMDRLLCGDVGYGKTEVAMRAAYKAVLAGKQVAVLVPTTILARQHLQSFSERMGPFGVRLQSLSRFSTAKEQRQTLQQMAEGSVDIVIATHRLLQNDIVFKDLGLLIIDEEQRFGIAQKERIKKFAVNIDVLTLSATPIPRTLHMTLLTAKDMSVIETAPESKMAVETYVVPDSDDIVSQAIRRELKRGGRVYYVVRFIEHMDAALRRIIKIAPDARVLTAHGRMSESRLENNIIGFYEGECDILLSTTIVENGLDVPQANTIIIQDADQFGLSQLYQMRGRVGRGVHISYAYLLHKPQKSISEIAQKRLDAIRSFTQLGAGFKIAMRDLEIRGAGSILGDKQHGHVLSIGFQAYCQLLEETIAGLKGLPDSGNLTFEPTVDIAVNMHISSAYMPDNSDKLEVYKRLAVIGGRQDAEALLDELIDRFGTPPADLVSMIAVAGIRGLCRTHGIKTFIVKGRELNIIFAEHTTVEPEAVVNLLNMYQQNIRILQGPVQKITLKIMKNDTDYLKLADKILRILLPNA